MKILYHQKNDSKLSDLGFHDCYLKSLSFSEDRPSVSEKQHHHNGFEVHIILSGSQFYELSGQRYAVRAGQFLMIPPGMKHRTDKIEEHTEKLSLTFRIDPSHLCFALPSEKQCYFGCLSAQLSENLRFMQEQAGHPTMLSHLLLENRYLETVSLLFRAVGISEEQNDLSKENAFHLIIPLAKQYISDNIESPPTIGDIVLYCGLSERQLARIFLKHEGVTLFDYIRRTRAARIEELLADPTLSLREISERMHFANEYYFNKFCKVNCGMPPRSYRKMKIENPQSNVANTLKTDTSTSL